ncbi:MAG TPA: tripartite tricarboxylate transporter substrate-binding protein, partial [Burkholderiales bacterium]|nr:tripartite tricarboxylate transporter substrate-binding protein [Burkholderiales bacterium]
MTSAHRIAEAPNVPTIAESGYPGFDVSPWYGIVAPAGTPRETIDYLNREIV